MSFIPRPHEIYKHFKGNLYQITAIAEHTETGELLVVYQALYDEFKTYARPLSMFTERVDRKKYPDVVQEFRFQLQGPDAGRQEEESEKQGTEQNRPTGQQGVEPEQQAAAFPDPETEEMEAAWQTSQEISEPCPEMEQEEELAIDPLVLEFLDADNYGQRLNILAALHHRITDDMITTMAIACDIEINDGNVEERYEALKACLLTLEHYECNRLR